MTNVPSQVGSDSIFILFLFSLSCAFKGNGLRVACRVTDTQGQLFFYFQDPHSNTPVRHIICQSSDYLMQWVLVIELNIYTVSVVSSAKSTQIMWSFKRTIRP